MTYAHTVTVAEGYQQAVQQIKGHPAEQGVGILRALIVKRAPRPDDPVYGSKET